MNHDELYDYVQFLNTNESKKLCESTTYYIDSAEQLPDKLLKNFKILIAKCNCFVACFFGLFNEGKAKQKMNKTAACQNSSLITIAKNYTCKS